jgi:hypothetical protein
MRADAAEALRATIHCLHAEGHTPREIARLAGCHPQTVTSALASGPRADRRRSAQAAERGERKTVDDPAVHAAVAALARTNLSVAQIAAQVARDFGPNAASPDAIGQVVAATWGGTPDGYRGPTAEDLAAAAAADRGSLDAEVEMLRAYILSLHRQVANSSEDARGRLRLLREIRELVDCAARAFRASHAVPASDHSPDKAAFDRDCDERLQPGEHDGRHDSPPAPPAGA